jgi:hypothetical protein
LIAETGGGGDRRPTAGDRHIAGKGQRRPAGNDALEIDAALVIKRGGPLDKGHAQRPRHPPELLEASGIAGRRERKHPDTVAETAQDRQVAEDSEAIEFGGQRQAGALAFTGVVERHGPCGRSGQTGTQLGDLSHQALFDQVGMVIRQQGVTQKPRQSGDPVIVIPGRLGSGALDGGIVRSGR